VSKICTESALLLEKMELPSLAVAQAVSEVCGRGKWFRVNRCPFANYELGPKEL